MSIANEIQRLQTAKADIKVAIEKKGVEVGEETIDTYAEKIGKILIGGREDYEQGYEDGKNSVVDVGTIAQTISFRNLNLFKAKEVVLNLYNVVDLTETFRRSVKNLNGYEPNNTVEHITINCPNKIVSMYYFCAGETGDSEEHTLKHLTLNVDTQCAAEWNYCFRWVPSLQIIDGTPLDFSSATNVLRMFDQCKALEEVRFVPNSLKISITLPQSSKLSADTIQSIIDGLADLSGEEQYIEAGSEVGPSIFGYPEEEIVLEDIHEVMNMTGYSMEDGAPVYRVIYGSAYLDTWAYKKSTGGAAQTLTLHSDVVAKLTNEQKATIAAKNWILA